MEAPVDDAGYFNNPVQADANHKSCLKEVIQCQMSLFTSAVTRLCLTGLDPVVPAFRTTAPDSEPASLWPWRFRVIWMLMNLRVWSCVQRCRIRDESEQEGISSGGDTAIRFDQRAHCGGTRWLEWN